MSNSKLFVETMNFLRSKYGWIFQACCRKFSMGLIK